MKIHIGYEKETGEPVDIELSPTSPHIAIFGQTGLGKTVLVRRIIEEIPNDYRILAFDTREGVEEFRGEGHRLPIYVRETTDSLVLKGLLESIIQSSLKREYATLVRVTEGCDDYDEVIDRLTERIGDKKTHAVVKDMMVLLRDLLKRLKAEMAETETASDVDLRPGLNVMALNERSKQFKQLAVRAVLPLVYRKYRKLVVFLDEGQEYIPQKYSSAAKEAVDDYIRTARGKDDYMVIAAQSITGTDKDPLKQVHTWMHFGQATRGEAKEAIEYIPHAEKLDLTVREVQTMGTGFAVVSTKAQAWRTYIQPKGMVRQVAIDIAIEGAVPPDILQFIKREEAKLMDDEERQKYVAEVNKLTRIAEEQNDEVLRLRKQLEEARFDLKTLKEELEEIRGTRQVLAREVIRENLSEVFPGLNPAAGRPEPIYETGGIPIEALARKVAEMLGTLEFRLTLEKSVPELVLKEKIVELEANDQENTGRFALLIAEGWMDAARTLPDIQKEFRRRGWGSWTGGAGKASMTRIAKKFASWGFVRVDDDTVSLVSGMKKRIRRVGERE